jgi:hypothetical protein
MRSALTCSKPNLSNEGSPRMENWRQHFGGREYVSVADLLTLEAKTNARVERLQKMGALRSAQLSCLFHATDFSL